MSCASSCAPSSSSIGLGGEELLIALLGIGLQGAREVAERLRSAVEQLRPTGIPITISLGVSAGHGEQINYESLLKAANAALYEAKRAGRNRVVLAPAATVELQAPGADTVALDASQLVGSASAR
jgi:diguanylate cyclase (GGDEF)-like protein